MKSRGITVSDEDVRVLNRRRDSADFVHILQKKPKN